MPRSTFARVSALLILLVACAPWVRAQTPPRAVAGDTVWVIVNHVKPDQRSQFERFVEDVFWGTASRLGAHEQRAFRQTRVLYPTAPEEDGTYAYLFVMDPLIPGMNYSIYDFLVTMYGEADAAKHYRAFEATLAEPFRQYLSVQSAY